MHVGVEAEITADTKIAALAETWFARSLKPGAPRAHCGRVETGSTAG
jgi:hypothetical protein